MWKSKVTDIVLYNCMRKRFRTHTPCDHAHKKSMNGYSKATVLMHLFCWFHGTFKLEGVTDHFHNKALLLGFWGGGGVVLYQGRIEPLYRPCLYPMFTIWLKFCMVGWLSSCIAGYMYLYSCIAYEINTYFMNWVGIKICTNGDLGIRMTHKCNWMAGNGDSFTDS